MCMHESRHTYLSSINKDIMPLHIQTRWCPLALSFNNCSLKPFKACIGLTIHVLHDPFILFTFMGNGIQSHPQLGQGCGDLIEDVVNPYGPSFKNFKMFLVVTYAPLGL